jgi:hypothetical protein
VDVDFATGLTFAGAGSTGTLPQANAIINNAAAATQIDNNAEFFVILMPLGLTPFRGGAKRGAFKMISLSL